MRKTFLSVLTLILTSAVIGQAKPVAPAPEFLVARESSYDFGRIPQGKPVTHNFVISNTGKDPIVIENVQASCGCTTPEWSKEPIQAGKSSEIKVGYNSASEGPFEKTITVLYNQGQTKTLVIKGNVWRLHEQTAPKNNSVSLLKNVN
ncbi:MAG TPA: DUF1573 domain-containing protein [Chitinophagaceae bacterium]|nr:DUF1573 domain-containing protein [Chitinophagaceae bacterium]